MLNNETVTTITYFVALIKLFNVLTCVNSGNALIYLFHIYIEKKVLFSFFYLILEKDLSNHKSKVDRFLMQESFFSVYILEI